MTYTTDGEEQEAAGLLALARQMHEQHVAKGKLQAEELVRNAQAEAERIVREATETAQREVADAHEELRWLQEQISEHRDFERQYRESLRDYLTSLLSNFEDGDKFIPSSQREAEVVEKVYDVPAPEVATEVEAPVYEAAPSEDVYALDAPFEAPQFEESAPVVDEPVAYEPPAVEADYPAVFTPEEYAAPVNEEPVYDGPVAPVDTYTSFDAPVEEIPAEENPVYESPTETFDWESPAVAPSEDIVSDAELSDIINNIDTDPAPIDEPVADFQAGEETAFESTVDAASFDEILNGEPATEGSEAPTFEPFVPGASVADTEDVNKKLKGFFGRRKD